MAFITVGIHENLTISKETKVNEKGTLELFLKTVGGSDNLLDAFTSNQTMDSLEGRFFVFGPNLKTTKGELKSAAEIGKELLNIRHILMQYGKIYTTEVTVNKHIGGTALFDGLGIAPENLNNALGMLNKEDFLKKVIANLFNKFIKMLEEVNAFNGGVAFRHKFVRQSPSKHYATLPNSTFDTWVESMEVPKEASAVKYTEWEIANGKDSGVPVKTETSGTTAADKAKAESLFDVPANNDMTSLFGQ